MPSLQKLKITQGSEPYGELKEALDSLKASRPQLEVEVLVLEYRIDG